MRPPRGTTGRPAGQAGRPGKRGGANLGKGAAASRTRSPHRFPGACLPPLPSPSQPPCPCPSPSLLLPSSWARHRVASLQEQLGDAMAAAEGPRSSLALATSLGVSLSVAGSQVPGCRGPRDLFDQLARTLFGMHFATTQFKGLLHRAFGGRRQEPSREHNQR